MGLFSFFRKNKQDRTAEDSGRFYSKDDDAALGERARAKRASNASRGTGGGASGGATRRPGNDPLLPEKKRARRRLVGAIALALAAAVGLPMLLDSAPKQLASDIAIQIPSKDKAAPLPVPGQPAASAPQAAGDKTVAAEDSVDKGEEIVEAPPAAPKAPKAETRPEPKPEPKPERKAETPKPQPKPEPKPEHKEPKPEHKEPKPEHKESKAETRLAEKTDRPKPEEKAKPKVEEKVKPVHDDARALAILEAKPAEKQKDKADDASSQKFVVQVAAMSSQEKAAELQAKLREAGISSWTQKAGELVKVKVGPLKKEDAEKVRAKLGRIGYSGFMTPV
jgi:DedD protein